MNAHHRGLVTELVGVRRWPTERLGPVRSKALSVLGMVSVAERMANDFVLEHPSVPRVGQLQQPIDTTRRFIDRLYVFSVHCRIMQHEVNGNDHAKGLHELAFIFIEL